MNKPVKSYFTPFLTRTFLLVICTSFFVQPALAEDFSFPGLSGTVTVTEDQYGIPTIRGDSELDVVFVQGYLHARDRFFQMDRDRKGAAGRAAELLGEAALSSDVLYRTFGLDRAAMKTWAALDADTKGWLQAYANGVNTYLNNNPLPPEYTLLELTKTDPWTVMDSILIGKGLAAGFSLDTGDIDNTIRLGAYSAVGEIAGINGQALFFEDTHRSAPPDGRVTAPDFLSAMAAAAGQNVEAAPGKIDKPRIEVTGNQQVSETTLALAKKFKAQLDNAPLARKFMQNREQPNGSNAWLVSGEHTASGNPMIANDPHLTMNTPAIWYEAHLVFNRDGEEWHINGVNPPGEPGALLGCNNAACWGMTVNPLDITDFFQEQFLTNALTLPTHTVYKGTPEPIQQVFNSWFINVIGDGVPDNMVRAPVGYTDGAISLVIPRRNDGPVVSIDGNAGISAAFTGFRDTHELTMFRKLDLSRNLDELQEALSYFDVGVQNVYWADVEGNIAWITTSEKPLREDLASFTIDGLPPWFIRDGTGAAANEWLPVSNPQPNQALDFEILPADEMPHLINPANGFVTNANNDPVGTTLDNVPYNEVRPSGTGLYYLDSHYSAYRMGRVDREVKALIDSGTPVTVDHLKNIQANVNLPDAELVLPTLLAIMSQVPVPNPSPMAQALDVLSDWDYKANTGIAEGWDAGDDPVMTTEPTEQEVRSAAAATVFAMWRSMLVQNTINATLTAYGLGDYLPPSTAAYNAFKYHLENYPTAGGVGASGVNFFSNGLAETVAGSLQMALERLASDEFAPAFANSTDVLDYAWGKLHRITFDHTLNADPLNIPNGGGFMDLEPDLPGLARQGGYQAVDASSHSATADGLNEFMFGHGPSRRFVADMAPMAVEAEEVIPGGQSGLFYHPNYSSQLPLWLTNGYHPMALTTEDADAVAVSTYTFGPAMPAEGSEEENNND
ncbi:MAG: penicillin acylase family protein [Xanthomonadales bacterium]|jgi:penicillin amidase|nr:penicillin acylase family protein [Xanthomonadales bacterium]